MNKFTLLGAFLITALSIACSKESVPEPIACANLNKDTVVVFNEVLISNCSKSEEATFQVVTRGESSTTADQHSFNPDNQATHQFTSAGDFDVVITASNASKKEEKTHVIRYPITVELN
ncbi:MAG: hypothetical protein ACJAY8_000162 [Sphingobacteriales bacterium]|jgi:hypothetical protein